MIGAAAKMPPSPRSVLVRNRANLVSVLGVLPICLLFVDGGYKYLIPIMVFNNVMDDLDGIIASKLGSASAFGAALDNVCDAVAHVALALAVGMHHGGLCAVVSLLTVAAMLMRVVSRVVSHEAATAGSPTNELMRHLMLALLLASQFEFEPGGVLALIFASHAVSLILPYRMPGLIRSLTKSVFTVALVNASLFMAWQVPAATPLVAAAFGLTYVYGFLAGGLRWASGRGAGDGPAQE